MRAPLQGALIATGIIALTMYPFAGAMDEDRQPERVAEQLHRRLARGAGSGVDRGGRVGGYLDSQVNSPIDSAAIGGPVETNTCERYG